MSWNTMRPGRKDDRAKVRRAFRTARKEANKKGSAAALPFVKRPPKAPGTGRNRGVPGRAWAREMRRMPCHYCGERGGTVDHIIPRSQGGRTIKENCVPACGPCNNFRKDKPYEWFKTVGWKERPFA